jgi:threonine synthase
VVFLETAHPTKFLDVVEDVIEKTVPLPTQIEAVMDKEKVAIAVNSYEELKVFLLK